MVTVAPTYTWGYFFGYNMIGSFLITLLVPGLTLGTFNTLIWRRLQMIWRNRSAVKRNLFSSAPTQLFLTSFIPKLSLNSNDKLHEFASSERRTQNMRRRNQK